MLRRLAVLPLLAAVAGCAHNDVLMQKQVELEARIEQLAQSSKALQSRITEMTGTVHELQERVQAQGTALDEMKLTVRPPAPLIEESLSDKPQVDKKTADATAKSSRIEVINKDSAPADKEPAPSEAYIKAFGLYSANNYPAAIDSFSAFIRAYPGSEFAGNAQYWIGECYYTMNDLPHALEAFKKVVETYPKGNKVPDAMLKMGYTLSAMKESEKARAVLESLIAAYPPSNHAVIKAKERLKGR